MKLSISCVNKSLFSVLGHMSKEQIHIEDSYYLDLKDMNNLHLSSLLEKNKLRNIKTYLGLDQKYFQHDFIKLDDLRKGELRKFLSSKYKNLKDREIQYLISKDFYGERLNILVLYIERERLRELKERTNTLYLKLKSIGFNNYNIVKLLNFGRKINNNYKLENKEIMTCNLDFKSIETTVFNHMKINYITNSKLGMPKFIDGIEQIKNMKNIFHLDDSCQEDYEVLDYISMLLDCINITIDYYELEFEKKISYVVLTGPGSSMDGIENFLTSNTHKQVIVLRNLEGVYVEEDLNIYASAIGGLIQGRKINHV